MKLKSKLVLFKGLYKLSNIKALDPSNTFPLLRCWLTKQWFELITYCGNCLKFCNNGQNGWRDTWEKVAQDEIKDIK